MQLCSIFASDPFVMAFAKLMQSGLSKALLICLYRLLQQNFL